MLNGRNTLEKAKIALLGMQRHSWEQGVAMQAFLEQGDMDVVIAMAKEAVYRRADDGRLAIIGYMNAVTDPVSPGEALLAAVKQTGDRDLKKAYEDMLEWALRKAPRNENGVVYHLDDKPQIWVDSMYMLPPVLASAGYPREALVNLYGYWNLLYDGEKKLLSHIWDDKAKVFVRKAFWGVGNGWALAAFARMYDLLPAAYESDKKKVAEKARDLISAALAYKRPDNLFHDVLDDPSTFVETNFSQMLAYTLYRGMKSGWLDASYKETADALRKAVNAKVDTYGLVQGVCGAPSFDKGGVAPEGQAFYLLMEASAGFKG
jgi:rhamnogalacturonyl hydrolase YesR